jgi:hypothetical protein
MVSIQQTAAYAEELSNVQATLPHVGEEEAEAAVEAAERDTQGLLLQTRTHLHSVASFSDYAIPLAPGSSASERRVFAHTPHNPLHNPQPPHLPHNAQSSAGSDHDNAWNSCLAAEGGGSFGGDDGGGCGSGAGGRAGEVGAWGVVGGLGEPIGRHFPTGGGGGNVDSAGAANGNRSVVCAGEVCGPGGAGMVPGNKRTAGKKSEKSSIEIVTF